MSSPILLYDGLCSFCDGAVQFVLRNERDGVIRFAPLQGEYAQALMQRHPWLHQVDSLMLVEEVEGKEHVYVRSAGALRVAELMGGKWSLLTLLRIIPGFVRDWGYDLFARNRFRMFGRLQTCRLPSPEQRARFLE